MYRFIVTLLQPFTFLALGILVATALLWRPPRPARRRTLAGLSFLVALAALVYLPPVGHLALLSLEWPYPPRDDVSPDVETIVVLSGGLEVYDRDGKHVELSPDSLYRCLHASQLYKQCGGCRIVVTGGKVESDRPGPTLASAMRDFLVHVGVDPSDILVEEKARTTYENAVESRKLLQPLGVDRILLVTTATHMLRSARCFQRQGFEVIPAACNHHANYFQLKPASFLPSSRAATDIETAAHEWLGLLWYWLRGRI